MNIKMNVFNILFASRLWLQILFLDFAIWLSKFGIFYVTFIYSEILISNRGGDAYGNVNEKFCLRQRESSCTYAISLREK